MHLRSTSTTQVYALLRAHPEYGDLTPTQYLIAYEWLRDRGLLDSACATEEPSILFSKQPCRSRCGSQILIY